MIGGVGLFGTMLADKLARPIAEALVNKVNNILEARDEEEARQLEHIRSGGGAFIYVCTLTDMGMPRCGLLGRAVGPAPPVIVPPTPVSPTKAKVRMHRSVCASSML